MRRILAALLMAFPAALAAQVAPSLIASLVRRHASGVLTFALDGGSRSVTLREGDFTAAQSTHADDGLVAATLDEIDLDRDCSFPGELDRIADQIHEDLTAVLGIADHGVVRLHCSITTTIRQHALDHNKRGQLADALRITPRVEAGVRIGTEDEEQLVVGARCVDVRQGVHREGLTVALGVDVADGKSH